MGGGDARLLAPANNRDSIASAAYVTEAPPARKTIARRQRSKEPVQRKAFVQQKSEEFPPGEIEGEKAAGRVTEETRPIAPMLLRPLYYSFTGARRFGCQCGKPDGCNIQ